MKPLRLAAVLLAWSFPLAALALIGAWAHRYHPGALRTVAALLHETRPLPPKVLTLGGFGSEAEAGRWRRDGAELVAREGWGRVTFRRGPGFPGIRLSDYPSGPGRARDWSPYRRLAWRMRVPRGTDRPLMLIVKDAGERRFERGFPLPPGGEERRAAVDLAEMAPWLDLTRIKEIHFFMAKPDEEAVVELADLQLEKDGPPGAVLGTPFVAFERLDAPPSARLGGTVRISAWLSLTRPQTIPYSVFVHLYPEAEKGVEVPAHREGYIHIEHVPYPPVTAWPVGVPREVGPFTVYLPRYAPAGRYLIRIGLFHSAAGGNGPRDVPYRGAYDYSGSFPKCRYTDQGLEDFVVGAIEVEEESAGDPS